MVVINRNRKTALAVRRTGCAVLMIVMRSGKLTTSYVKHQEFETEWREMKKSMEQALITFSRHAKKNGATQSALNALKKLTKEQESASLRLF
ncbi:hypothetical protein SFSGTM_17010 [Sulfuriferula nivalis]|uniref:Uncharacterized protein n=2 Tax=Sulfuriferula nivalis TaxID=2675298 RepID=A0A809S945_9PROT|nr:hypothetical protein SFSGTM_17010 [Sulfuriferula nivalis]